MRSSVLLPSGESKFTGRGGGIGRKGDRPAPPVARRDWRYADGPVSGLTACPGGLSASPSHRDSGSGCRLGLRDAACAVYRCGGSAGMAIDSRTGFPISPGLRPGHLSSRAILGRRPGRSSRPLTSARGAPQCWPHGAIGTARGGARGGRGRGGTHPRDAIAGVDCCAREGGRLAGHRCRRRGRAGDPRDRRRRAFPRTVSTARSPPRTRLDAEHALDRRSDRRHEVLRAPLPDVLDPDRASCSADGSSSAFPAAPVYGETAWAERGGGACLDGAPLAVSRIATLEQATLSTGNLRSLASGPRWAALGRIVARLDRIRGFGDFLHYHLLAAGKIDAVLESDINILDIAALTVIVEEAGGRVTDLEGAPIGLGSRSILATNGALHETILAALGRLARSGADEHPLPAPGELADRHLVELRQVRVARGSSPRRRSRQRPSPNRSSALSAATRRERRVVQGRDDEATRIGAGAEQRQRSRCGGAGRGDWSARRAGRRRRPARGASRRRAAVVRRRRANRRRARPGSSSPTARERAARAGEIGGILPLPEGQVRMPADQRGLEHGRGKRLLGELRQEREAARALASRPGRRCRDLRAARRRRPAARRPASVCSVSVLPTPFRPSTAMNSPPRASRSSAAHERSGRATETSTARQASRGAPLRLRAAAARDARARPGIGRRRRAR